MKEFEFVVCYKDGSENTIVYASRMTWRDGFFHFEQRTNESDAEEPAWKVNTMIAMDCVKRIHIKDITERIKAYAEGRAV